jgi:hypothetical protein
MQKLFRLSSFILLAGLLLSSCSDMSMFTPSVKESVGVKVLSLSEGDFLEPGDSIDFVIQAEDPDSAPELLEIELITQSGLSVWNTGISSPLTDEELELVLPDLETGRYTIVFTIHGEEGVAEEKKVDFFYIAGRYDILGISSYPPTIMAGHETVIEAELLYPAGANPYIRWSQGNAVLAKGPANDGLTSITWMAPQEEGVYPIRVELFPVPPATGTDFSFSSSLALTAQLYVSTENLLTEDELVPENAYYSLFHLNGSLRNSGLLGEQKSAKEARSIGGARLSSGKGIIGYATGSGAGLFYPLNILPVSEGELSPCTITFKLVPSEENKDRNLMLISDRSEDFRFQMAFDSEGQLVATIAFGDSLLYLPSQIYDLKPEQHLRIDLSLVPLADSLQALWFLDGLQTASVVEAPLPADLTQEGETIVSGENGFAGIITELGVYYKDPLDRPSVDPAIYRETMRQKHGRRLILAEGFEGLYLPDPDSWRLQSKDPAFLAGGRLILLASSRLSLPYFELGGEDTAFLIEFFGEIPPGSRIALQWEGAENPFLTIDPRGEIFSGSESAESEEFSPLDSILRLNLSRGGVILQTANTPIRYSFRTPADRNTWLSVILQSPEKKGELEIDTILIVQEQSSSS